MKEPKYPHSPGHPLETPVTKPVAPPKRRKRRPPAQERLIEAAKKALQSRPRRTLKSGEEALDVWTSVRIHGAPASRLPVEPGAHAAMIGETYELQVVRLVEETAGFESWRRGEIARADFVDAIMEGLPVEIPLPWEGLAPVEQEALDRGESPEASEETSRLLPGLRREE